MSVNWIRVKTETQLKKKFTLKKMTQNPKKKGKKSINFVFFIVILMEAKKKKSWKKGEKEKYIHFDWGESKVIHLHTFHAVFSKWIQNEICTTASTSLQKKKSKKKLKKGEKWEKYANSLSIFIRLCLFFFYSSDWGQFLRLVVEKGHTLSLFSFRIIVTNAIRTRSIRVDTLFSLFYQHFFPPLLF